MELKKLTGGELIGIDSERLPVSTYADPPKIRVGAPGTVTGNVANYVQLSECSKREHGKPEPTMVKVLFRKIDGQLYLLMAPAWEEGPNVYAIKFEQTTQSLTLRGLKPLLQQAQLTIRNDRWYEIDTEIMQDETLGYVVAGCWTNAQTTARVKADGTAVATVEQSLA